MSLPNKQNADDCASVLDISSTKADDCTFLESIGLQNPAESVASYDQEKYSPASLKEISSARDVNQMRLLNCMIHNPELDFESEDTNHLLNIAISDIELHKSYLAHFGNRDMALKAEKCHEEGNLHQFFQYLGELFIDEALMVNARQCYLKAIALNPAESKWSMQCLANTYAWLNDFENSYQCSLAAIVLDPVCDIFYTQLADVLKKSDKISLAIDVLKTGCAFAANTQNIESALTKFEDVQKPRERFLNSTSTMSLTSLLRKFHTVGMLQRTDAVAIETLDIFRISGQSASPWLDYRNSLETLFDDSYYSEQIGGHSYKTPLHHYLETGNEGTANPNRLFDNVYYRSKNASTNDGNIVPLLDYVLSFGWERSEPHVYFSTDNLTRSGLILEDNTTPLEQYLNSFPDNSYSPCRWFDPEFYISQVAEKSDWDEKQEPLSHYLGNFHTLKFDPHRLLHHDYLSTRYRNSKRNPVTEFLQEESIRFSPHPAIDESSIATHLKGFTPNDFLEYLCTTSLDSKDIKIRAFDPVFYSKNYPKIGVMCPQLHFLHYGYREGLAPNSFFSENYMWSRYPHLSFVNQTAVEIYYHTSSSCNFILTFAIINTHNSSDNRQLLEVLQHIALYTDVEVYIIAKFGGELLNSFQKVSHIYVFNMHRKETGCTDNTIHDTLIFLESQGVENILFCSSGIRDWMSECKNLGFSITLLMPENFCRLDVEKQQGIIKFADSILPDSVQSYEHCITRFPIDKLKCEIIHRVPYSSTRFRQLADINSNYSEKESRTLTVIGKGQRSLQDGFDTFINVARLYNNKYQTATKINFLWLDKSHLDGCTENSLIEIDEAISSFTIKSLTNVEVEEILPEADVLLCVSKDIVNTRDIVSLMKSGIAVLYFASNKACKEICSELAGVEIADGDCFSMAIKINELYNDEIQLKTRQLAAQSIAWCSYTISERTRKILQNVRATFSDLEDHVNYSRKDAIYFLSPDWTVSGVNTFTINLIRKLVERGYNAKILFTRGRNGNYPSPEFMPDVPRHFLQTANDGKWFEDVWGTLLEFLTKHDSAIVVPNYDFIGSSISPILPEHIGIVGISHSDDIEHYEHVYRLGHWWNKIIGVSDHITNSILDYNQSFKYNVQTIRYGVPLEHRLEPSAVKEKCELDGGAIKIVYSGRMILHQKRVDRYVELVSHLDRKNVDYELHLVGDGPELTWLKSVLENNDNVFLTGRLPKSEIIEILKASQLFVLLSDFEGLPLSLLEALTEGCIPVVSDIESGVHEILVDGTNSFICKKDDIESVAEKIRLLSIDQNLREAMSSAAYKTMVQHGLSDNDMTDQYAAVFDSIFKDIHSRSYCRPPSFSQRPGISGVLPPPWIK